MTERERRPRREVGNEEFNRAYYGDPADEASVRAAADNRNVIAAVLKKYAKQLPEDDLHTVGLTAMWKCLQYHRDGFNQKFTTSLHRFTEWECRRELRKQRGGRKKGALREVSLGDVAGSHAVRSLSRADPFRVDDRWDDDMRHVVECVELLPEEWQRRVIRQYYFDHMTMEQIGRTNGYSKEAARQKIYRSVEALRVICLETLGEPAGVLPG